MLNSIAVTLRDLGRHHEARLVLEEALDVHRAAGQPRLEAHGLAVLGDVLVAMGDASEARQCYTKSLEIRRAIGDRPGEGWMLHHLSRAQLGLGLVEEGRRLGGEAAVIAQEIGDTDLKAALQQLQHRSAV
jgi:tetratricopeptide (TPR) repeat protein